MNGDPFELLLQYPFTAKFFRTAAVFCNHEDSQNYLAVLYNAGVGVEKDDMAALYWFDRAVANGCDVAKKDRIGLLNAYKSNYSPSKFYSIMQLLAGRCACGDADVPRDVEKSAYWKVIGEGR